MFIFNEKSGLFRSNELILPVDIPNMFMKFAFEDSLKLLLLKNIQIETSTRRS